MPSTPNASPFISPLSRPTSAKLRSSLIIPSIPDILREFVQNSLDAESTRIDIWLDLTPGSPKLRVEDDGSGIPKDGLRKIGRRYGSSKHRHLETLAPMSTYGFRGEALASISALCLLEITSKVESEEKTYVKIIKNSKILFDGLSQRPLPRSSGTTVSIKDIFQGIPVRQASMAATSTASALGQCRKVVESLALVYPNVKWGMWEEQSGYGIAPKRVLQLSGGKTAVDVFKAIYGAAGAERIQAIRVSSATRRIDGFISLDGAISQTHQHLYINHFPIERSEIARVISKQFAASKFSLMTDDSLVDFTPGRRKSPRRVERYPIYVLDITLPPEDIDLAYEPRNGTVGIKASPSAFVDVGAKQQNEENLKAFVLAVIDEFLKRHSFVFPKSREDDGAPPSPIVPTPGATASNTIRTTTPVPQTRRSEEPENQFWSAKSTFWRAREGMGSTPTGRTNPMRELGYLPPDSPALGPERPISSLGKRKIGWIDDLASSVEGHVLPFTPPPLFPLEHAGQDISSETCGTCTKHHIASHCAEKRTRQTVSEVAIDPTRLANAEILGQVDGKFIACVLPPGPTTGPSNGKSAVVLVDQHAADERIAVEAALQGLCEGFLTDTMAVRYLEESPMIVLSREEAAILASSEVEDILRRWGILLDTASLDMMGDSTLEYFQIPILGIPETLEFRLSRKDPREMSNLVKLHLPFLAEHREEQGALLRDAGEGGVDWERALAWMPKEMLELVNSKACRNAIMFGDHLDRDQCARLLVQLAKTRHPFICAHGRPSFVPVISIGGGGERGKRQIDWRRWNSTAV